MITDLFTPASPNRKVRQFSLASAFISGFVGKQPQWGPVGYFTYKRCVDVSTPVLCDDLQWRLAGDLKVGQGIVGFDANVEGRGRFRHLRHGVILHNKVEKAQTLGVELEDGTVIYATPDHGWLVKLSETDNRLYWKETKDLAETHKGGPVHLLRPFGQPWETDTSREGGYIAAAYDGEGCLDRHNGVQFIQVQNEMLDQVCEFLTRMDVPFTQSKRKKIKGRKQVFVLRTSGRQNFYRALGRFQPQRLIAKFRDRLKSKGGGALRTSTEDYIKVVRVFDAGERDIAVISTSTETHFTGGFASHNTYARPTCGCNDPHTCGHPTEEFWQTCQRVVEGVYNVQKMHCRRLSLPWNEPKAQRSAQEMFQRMWDFKFTPPGRGLAQMGAPFMFKKGGAALNNCAFVSSDRIDEDFAGPFTFLMDMSMLGVGVGGDTRGAGKAKILKPKMTKTPFVVEDSREGWVALARTVLNSFVGKGSYPAVIDFSKVRSKGKRIRGFGGTASGPGPLAKLVKNIARTLMPEGVEVHFEESFGRKAKIMRLETVAAGDGAMYRVNSGHITDIFNMVGACVVAGGVRRCIPKGILVHTSEGLIPIEDVPVGSSVMTSKGYSKVTDWMDQGVQPISRVTTQMGVFEATDKHEIAVILDTKGSYEWKRLHELEPGDRMVFVDHLLEGTTTNLPPFTYEAPSSSTTCKDITVPPLTPDVAWLMGLFAGDGYVRLTDDSGEISIAVAEDQSEIKDKAEEVLALFGVNVRVEGPVDGNRCFKVRVKSKQLAAYFSQFKEPKTPLVVPTFVLRGTPDVRAAYVAGLSDADGSFKTRPMLVACSVYPDYLEQVQAVLASLGIPSRMTLHRDAVGTWQPLFHLKVVGDKAVRQFTKRVAPHILTFADPRETTRSGNDYGFPAEMARADGVSGWKGGRMAWSRYTRQVTVAKLEDLTGRTVKLVPVEVLDIEHDVREDATYDITVDAGEFVVQGGYLVHNSAEIMFGQADDEVFRNLKDPTSLKPLDARMASLQTSLLVAKKRADRKALKTEIEELQAQIDRHPLRSHRWASNNSIFGDVGMDYAEVGESIARNGEPGIFWLKNAQDFGRMVDPPNFKDRRAQGANPCITGDTIIFTAEGPRRADKMLDKPFRALVDGQHYGCKTGVFQTGVKPVYLLQTKEGHSIRVTADHQILTTAKVTRKKRYEAWMETQDLAPGDKVILNNVRTCEGRDGDRVHNLPLDWSGMGTFNQGWVLGNLLGDGHFKADQETGVLQFWGDTKDEMLALALQRIETLGGDPRYHQQRTGTTVDDRDMVSAKTRQAWLMAPEFGIAHNKDITNDTVLTASSEFQKGFLRGIFDADGSVQGDQQKGVSVRLDLANRQHLAIVQKMLMNFGINSTIYDNRREAGSRLLPDGKGGQSMYDCEAMHDLVVSNDNIRVFADRVGFDEPERKAKLAALLDSYKRRFNRDRFVAEVESVNYVGIEPVFDCTVDEVHRFGANGIIVHNCAEQTLESFELCCVSSDTRITTRTGAPHIAAVVGQEVDVWNGEQWSTVTPFIAAQGKKLYRVHLSDGSFLDCTDDHKWEVLPPGKRKFRQVETKDLVLGSKSAAFDITLPCEGEQVEFAYEWGFFTGDGYLEHDTQQVMAKLHGPDRMLGNILRCKVYKEQHPEGYTSPFNRINFTGFFREAHPDDFMSRAVALNDKASGLPDWTFKMDRESTLRFVAGWIEADGNVCKQVNTDNYRVFGTEAKMRDLQMLLRRSGVNHASVYLMAEAGETLAINGRETTRNHDLWVCLIPSYECEEISRYCHLKVARRFGSRYAANNAHPEGAPIDRARKQKIVDIEELPGEHTTYCFSEPERHMGVFGNVLTYQCLVETYPAHHDSYEDFQRTLKFAYLYGKSVTLMPTHDPRTNAVMNRNRRIGCSMSGIRQAIDKLGRREFLNWCDRGYGYIGELDTIYSEWLGIPLSIKTTSVKPSGTVSLLCGATPGIHPPHSEFYIRNIRVNEHSPLRQAAIAAGYRVEKDAYADGTFVISFPVKTENCHKGKKDVSIWEQVALAADLQRYWADNQVSVTVTFKPEEAAEIPTVLEVFEDRLKAISFLPLKDDHGYVQAPYIAISADEYDAAVARITPMDLAATKQDMEDKFCDGESCQIDFSNPS